MYKFELLMKMYNFFLDPAKVLTVRKCLHIKIIFQNMLTKFITTHLPVASSCSMITQMCLWNRFDNKKQKRKAQD